MNTRPTPETDSAYTQRPNEGAWDFRLRQEKSMEKLERERDEARFDLDFRRRLGDLQNKTIDDLAAQRDRLAAALHKVSRSWNYVEVAQKALQSLTPNVTP
jgi:hypothetical protein